MNKDLAGHALDCLTHPVSILAALTLLLNAWVLQPAWPSWWTGKFGDVAWLIFAPSLAGLGLAVILPGRWRVTHRQAGILSLVSVGVLFGALKAVPPLNEAAVRLAASMGYPVKLRLDPTDLLALPGLMIAAKIWLGGRRRSVPWIPRIAAVSLASLAIMADMAGVTPLGITCVVQEGDTLVAYREVINPGGYFGKPFNAFREVYRSSDGGEMWKADETLADKEFVCPDRPDAWPVALSADENAQLFFVEGQGVYRSVDGGETLVLEQRMTAAESVLVYPPSGAVIIGAGLDGLLVRSPNGTWQVKVK